MIKITAKKDGFRRAGISHSGTREYPDSRFDKYQLEELKNEPMLVVEVLPDRPAKETAKDSDKEDKKGK